MKSVFFGTPQLAITILDALKKSGIIPSLIITAPDKPQGRKLVLTPPPVKVWAQKENIPYIQPHKLDEEVHDTLSKEDWDLFLVAAYGKIIPQSVLDLPHKGTLNVHPSLLPHYRGASPIISQILADDSHVGVTIMLLDEHMDHGPILAQKEVPIHSWPPKGSDLENILAQEGGALLAHTIPLWLQGKITPKEQDHSKATFVKKITKEDGKIDLSDDPYQNFLKIQAFDVWPRTYFFVEKNGKPLRVVITEAFYREGELVITKVIPEGKKEMNYKDFMRSL